MPSADAAHAVDQYLSRLRKALRGIPAEDRDDIVEEIRGHVLERIESGGDATPRAVESVLRAVGDPGLLARQYETDGMLRHAVTSRSPWVLLRTTARWARRGAAGLLALLVAAAGYGSALVCYACAVARPMFPSQFGMWLTPEHNVTIGYFSGRLPSALMGLSVGPTAGLVVLGTFGETQGPVRELLGPWLTPAGLVVGLLLALATTWCVRRLIARRLQDRRGGPLVAAAPAA